MKGVFGLSPKSSLNHTLPQCSFLCFYLQIMYPMENPRKHLTDVVKVLGLKLF